VVVKLVIADPDQDFEQPYVAAATEDALAEIFVQKHANHLRYVAKWGVWMRYHDGRWQEETTLLAFDLAREICREASRGCNKMSETKALCSAKTIAAVERIARADRTLVATVGQWDADPWLLNTPAGVVELKSGEMRPARPDDYMTKITKVAPDGRDNCPLWKEHLNKIFENDQALVDYMQRLFGYCLTGDTREHSLHYCWGKGRNGKGTTINTFADILGDYHKTAPTEMFIASKTERHPTDMAMLRGMRLVTTSETEKGQRWAESKIKNLTGGDPISARFMRQDYFDYMPQFKICISGNHKPGLRTVDDAIKARMHLIPFNVYIPKEERDTEVMTKLQVEWAGILQWAIEGCRAWQREGLRRPAAVEAASEEYVNDADLLSLWFEDMCVKKKESSLYTFELYPSYAQWAKDRGEFVMSMREFSGELADRATEFGLKKNRDLWRGKQHGRGFDGVAFRDFETRPQPPM
jgi:putative DNA primase/helicase